MRIYIARHGQTEWNLAGRIQGRGDSPLTPLGQAQARALGLAWQGLGIQTLYSSPLQRAMDTASQAGALLAASCRSEAGLAERAFGEFEGMPIQTLRQQHPECDQIILGTGPERAAPGGESLRAVADRVEAAVQRLAAASTESVLGMVSHGHCLLALVWRLCGEPDDIRRFHHTNASFSELEWQHGQLRVLRWAVASHVAGEVFSPAVPAAAG